MPLLKPLGAALSLAAGFAVAIVVATTAGADTVTPTISVDTSFNGGNPVLLDFPAPAGATGSSYQETMAIARQDDGKVVVAGYHSVGSDSDFDVARLNSDGTLDTSFGTNGYAVVTPVPGTSNYVYGVAIQADGKIVIAGTANFQEIALARLDANGNLDTSFGTNGVVLDDHAQAAYALALDGNGDIDVATSNGAVYRYTSSGAADTTFDTTGRSPSLMSEARGLAIQPDGKIVIAGQTSNTSAEVARVDSDGTGDTGFGTSGVTNITPGGGSEGLDSVALEDGNILVAGEVNQGSGSVVARLTSAGALDASFGTGGRIVDTVSGDTVAGIFYSPHPAIVMVTNDSDESQGDAPDDQDSRTCTLDPTTGATIVCVPARDSESGGSVQAGAQSVGADGSTVDTGGSTPDGSHATVSQAVTSDSPGGSSSSSSTETTTTPQCPPPGSPYTKCADFVMDPGFEAKADIDVFGGHWAVPAHDDAFVPGVDNIDVQVKVTNNGPDPADCYAYLQSAGGPGGEDVCGRQIGAGVKETLDFYDAGPIDRTVTSSEIMLTSRVYATDADDPVPGDPAINDDERNFYIATAKPPVGEAVFDSATPTGAAGEASSRSPSSSVATGSIKRVDVAIMNVVGKSKCRWVSSLRGGLTAAHPSTACSAPVWLRAHGVRHWTLRLTRRLARGRYAFLVRVVDSRGRVSSGFAPRRHTVATVTVR